MARRGDEENNGIEGRGGDEKRLDEEERRVDGHEGNNNNIK